MFLHVHISMYLMSLLCLRLMVGDELEHASVLVAYRESDFFLSRPVTDRAFLTVLQPELIAPVLFPMLVKTKPKQNKTQNRKVFTDIG